MLLIEISFVVAQKILCLPILILEGLLNPRNQAINGGTEPKQWNVYRVVIGGRIRKKDKSQGGASGIEVNLVDR